MPTDHIPFADTGHNAGIANVDVASQKQDLARQVMSAEKGSEGGLIAQLSNNPFFTAVRWTTRSCLKSH